MPVIQNVNFSAGRPIQPPSARELTSAFNNASNVLMQIDKGNKEEARYNEAKRLAAIQQGIVNDRANKELELRQKADTRIEDSLARQQRAQKAISKIALTEPVMEEKVANQDVIDKILAANTAVVSNAQKKKDAEILKAQEEASKQYLKDYEDNKTKFGQTTVDTIVGKGQGIPYQIKKVPNPGGAAQEKYITANGDELAFNPKGLFGRMVYGNKYSEGIPSTKPGVPMPKYSEQQSGELALQSSGVLNVPELGSVKVDVTKELQKVPTKRLENKDTGKVQTIDRDKYLAKVNKIAAREGLLPTEYKALVEQADVLFPKAKNVDPVKVKELQLKEEELQAKINAGYFGKGKSPDAKSSTTKSINKMIEGVGNPSELVDQVSLLRKNGVSEDEIYKRMIKAQAHQPNTRWYELGDWGLRDVNLSTK